MNGPHAKTALSHTFILMPVIDRNSAWRGDSAGARNAWLDRISGPASARWGYDAVAVSTRGEWAMGRERQAEESARVTSTRRGGSAWLVSARPKRWVCVTPSAMWANLEAEAEGSSLAPELVYCPSSNRSQLSKLLYSNRFIYFRVIAVKHISWSSCLSFFDLVQYQKCLTQTSYVCSEKRKKRKISKSRVFLCINSYVQSHGGDLSNDFVPAKNQNAEIYKDVIWLARRLRDRW